MMQTMSISTSVGMACSFYQPLILLEAVGLTASIVAGLTAYTFYASRKGHEFGCASGQLASQQRIIMTTACMAERE